MTHSSPVNAEALAEAFADACFAGHADGPSWSTVYHNMRSLSDALRIRAQQMPKPLSELEGEAWERGYQHGRAEALRAPAQCVPSRIDKGRAFYLAMYEKDGAIWAANDHKGLWCDMAEDYERRISALTSPERCTMCGGTTKHRGGCINDFAAQADAPAILPQCAPDREALVRAIQLSYARKDLEPTSATTLALYREDAEHAADAVLALTRPADAAPATPAAGLSERQRRLDASVSEAQAREYVRKERERNASRDKPIPAPSDGFINDYD